jgi:hypothetical protein
VLRQPPAAAAPAEAAAPQVFVVKAVHVATSKRVGGEGALPIHVKAGRQLSDETDSSSRGSGGGRSPQQQQGRGGAGANAGAGAGGPWQGFGLRGAPSSGSSSIPESEGTRWTGSSAEAASNEASQGARAAAAVPQSAGGAATGGGVRRAATPPGSRGASPRDGGGGGLSPGGAAGGGGGDRGGGEASSAAAAARGGQERLGCREIEESWDSPKVGTLHGDGCTPTFSSSRCADGADGAGGARGAGGPNGPKHGQAALPPPLSPRLQQARQHSSRFSTNSTQTLVCAVADGQAPPGSPCAGSAAAARFPRSPTPSSTVGPLPTFGGAAGADAAAHADGNGRWWWQRSSSGGGAGAAAREDGGQSDSSFSNANSAVLHARAKYAAERTVQLDRGWTPGKRRRAACLGLLLLIGVAGIVAPITLTKRRPWVGPVVAAKAVGFEVDTAVAAPARAAAGWGCAAALGSVQVRAG